MTQPVEIRLFTAQDKAAWLPLWKAYQDFYKTSIADAVTDISWERLLDAAEPMNGALAFVDGQAVGLAGEHDVVTAQGTERGGTKALLHDDVCALCQVLAIEQQ